MNMYFHIKQLSVLSFLLAALLLNSAAQGYSIQMKYTDNAIQNMQMELVWQIDKNNCKLQLKNRFEGKNVSSLFFTDRANNTIKMMDENPENGKKIFYTISTTSLKPDARFDYKRGKAVLTSEGKTIAGIPCKKVIFNTEKFNCEFWLAESLPDVKPWASFFQSYPELNGIAESELSGFPLASTIKDAAGNVIVTLEATNVQKTPLTEADFKVPSTYIDASTLQRK